MSEQSIPSTSQSQADQGSSTRSYVPLIEPATKTDLREISDSLKLSISDEDLSEYLEHVNDTLSACERLREIPEASLPVLYPRVPGVKPEKKDDPCNAWATKLEIKGEPTGILAGKRVAIKDNIFVAGTRLENGSQVWEGYTPEFDATVVTRILKAGGTILGKSRCENQCYSGSSFTCASGAVLNPHDKSRSAGGSSSGSAALIVNGEVDMALGGDQGGSIRMPSCWSGCVGLKPTWGLVPCTGSLGMEPTFDHIGPMAATVRDVALLLEAIAGYDEGRDHRQNPYMSVPEYSKLLVGDLGGKKLGYVKEGFRDCTPGVKAVIDGIVEKMKSTGATVDVISIPEEQKGGAVFNASILLHYDSMFLGHGQASGYNEFYNRSAGVHFKRSLQLHGGTLQPIVKGFALFGEYVRRKDSSGIKAMIMNQRPLITRAYDEALQLYDGLIMPTIPYVARKLPEKTLGIREWMREASDNLRNTRMANLTGHPAISLPVGFTLPEVEEGQGGDSPLPVGLQIMAGKFQETKLLDLAYGIEQLVSTTGLN